MLGDIDADISLRADWFAYSLEAVALLVFWAAGGLQALSDGRMLAGLDTLPVSWYCPVPFIGASFR